MSYMMSNIALISHLLTTVFDYAFVREHFSNIFIYSDSIDRSYKAKRTITSAKVISTLECNCGLT